MRCKRIVIEKWHDMVRSIYQHVVVGAIFALRGVPRYFWDFCNIFLPNIDEDQINVLPSERGAPDTVPYGNSGLGYCITFIKNVR